jgi:mRNA-degrading endonuclease RelE of RelBE toxin-antitoxin system
MQVIITPKAQKHYERLPKSDQKKIKKKLSVLENDPHSGKKLAGELKEQRSLKAWPYRIIYFINVADRKLYVTTIQHRQGVYK